MIPNETVPLTMEKAKMWKNIIFYNLLWLNMKRRCLNELFRPHAIIDDDAYVEAHIIYNENICNLECQLVIRRDSSNRKALKRDFFKNLII